ncbi:ATP-dependent helicase/nuclease subunit A [Evansella vedderi]|uniref:DNA 3'-5' helicase n=1 Tax=Evansella vedderi TaxID=38282 RepID=A0ABT9ZVZ9_9BACI|nr:UvrD-helicase domain-containing protein [Evansella vedderi]MDQ0254648.1 ATP-dependent helicase/nuclease subunit A [Evansella vedderi]
MTKIIVDQRARDKIKENLNTNFLVEAGAGSGKTTSLVDRIVNLIYTGTCTVDQIVAITFTRKAADELKVRFQSVLERVWKEESNEKVRGRLSHALQNIDQCFLGTVHSFCAKLLRERPIEAKLDLTFAELEEADDLEVIEEAWQIFLKKTQEEEESILKKLDDIGISVEELYGCFKEMKEYPDVEWVTKKVPKPELEASYRSLVGIIRDAKRSLPAKEPEKGYDALQKSLVIALQKLKHVDTVKEKHMIELFELFNKNLKPTYVRWDSKEDAVFYHEKIQALMDNSIKLLIKEWKEYCHPIIIHFLQKALSQYEQIKKERSLLNFQDLLINTANLLKNFPEVRGYFQEKYRCLLVDEFQDTDPIQAKIMFYLSSENHKEKVWTKCKPRPGSLFVVGDPKQAIYRFRRADIDTYNRVKQLLEEHGGEVLQLTMNFRTISAVTEELNNVFVEQLPEEETVYQAAYRPLNSYHESSEDKIVGIKTLPIPAAFTKKGEVMKEDASNIAKYIYYLLKNGYRANDFMVLTRYNDGITTYAQTIEDLGIPVSVSGEVIIGDIKEFKELVTLLAVFVDPTDEVALVAALRGVFIGLSDDDLYQWKVAGGRFSLYYDSSLELNESVKGKFQAAFDKLQLYQRWIRGNSPTIAIEKIMEDVGFYPLLLAREQGKRAYKSLLQILSALRKEEENNHTSYKSVYEQFKEMVYEKTVVVNLEDDVDAVRVMNIHKAKGLEAPIVFLAHPIKKVKPEEFISKHIKREDDGSRGYFLFRIKKGNVKRELAIPPEWDTMQKEELRYLTEEEIRIIYVAATRAEKAMIISSSMKTNNKNPWVSLLNIEGLEELQMPEMDFQAFEQEVQSITLSDYKSKTSNLYQWIEESKVKTFDTWSPTEDKDYSKVLTIDRESGGGKDWGSLIHDLLERVVQGYDTTHYVKHLLEKYNQPLEREKEVGEYIHAFKNSSIWMELQGAEEILTEVPFTLKVENENSLYPLVNNNDGDYHPILVKGIIDLTYKINGHWKIVDYKTDRVKSTEDIKLLSEFYKGQVQFYKLVWERLTNESVTSTELFFFEPRKNKQ